MPLSSHQLLLLVALLAATACAAFPSTAATALPHNGASPEFTISNTLGSNMVLQRAPFKAVLWGWGMPGGWVALHISSSTAAVASTNDYNVTVSSTGEWRIELEPTEAGGPYMLAFTPSHGTPATLSNILFGDVYFWQFTVDQLFNHTKEVAAAANFPSIRVMTVGQKTASSTPLQQLATIEQTWQEASPAAIGGGNWSDFSAVCWLFGRDVYTGLGGSIPVGLVSTNWGGTPVQAWSSPDALAKCSNALDSTTATTAAAAAAAAATNLGRDDEAAGANPHDNSTLYNAMIVPFLPMRAVGAIWYQGESNVGTAPQDGGTYYGCQFPAMIADWRLKFALPDLWFGFVQLAAYTEGVGQPYDVLLPQLRQSQLKALDLPRVGYSTAIDYGDLTSPFGNIHPRNKEPVAQRLADSCLAMQYGQHLVYQGPRFSSVTSSSMQGSTLTATVSFLADTLGSGLTLRDAYCPNALKLSNCGWYEFVLTDGTMVNATAAIAGDKLVITADIMSTHAASPAAAAAPAFVRYGWADWPVCSLYNKEGFPALPFNAKL